MYMFVDYLCMYVLSYCQVHSNVTLHDSQSLPILQSPGYMNLHVHVHAQYNSSYFCIDLPVTYCTFTCRLLSAYKKIYDLWSETANNSRTPPPLPPPPSSFIQLMAQIHKGGLNLTHGLNLNANNPGSKISAK